MPISGNFSISFMISSFDSNITCLLYTSDAADEEDSVDLGGRGINKKKKKDKGESRMPRQEDMTITKM